MTQIPAAQIGGEPVELSEHLQGVLKDLLRKAQKRDMFARRFEIRRAQKNRMFELGYQHLTWDEDLKVFQVGQAGGGYIDDEDELDADIERDVNLYLGYEKSFRSSFCQNSANVNFGPRDPKNPLHQPAADKANDYRRFIEKFNPPNVFQDEVGRLLWTDGRAVTLVEFVFDGEQFGWAEEEEEEETLEAQSHEDDSEVSDSEVSDSEMPEPEGSDSGGNEEQAKGRKAKGQEVIHVGGVLEWKVPLSIKNPMQWPYAIYSIEKDIATAKAENPKVEEKIRSGGGPTGLDQYARLARIAVSQAAGKFTGGGLTLEYLVTEDNAFFRPAFFTEVGTGGNDPDREELLKLFPDGCRVRFIGDVFCGAWNVSFARHVKAMPALRMSGWSVPGYGQPAIDPCETYNDLFSMGENAFKFCIPATIFRNGVLDLDAITEQQSQYGAHYEANAGVNETLPFADNFFTEPPAQVPATMPEMMQEIQGPLLQFLTSQLAPLFGGSDEHNETAKGISILREAALGLMTLVWRPFCQFYGETMQAAIECGAHYRLENGETKCSTLVDVPGKKGQQEPVEIELEDLEGNFVLCPVVDANFPESYTQKVNRFSQVFSMAGTNPVVARWFAHPDNQALALEYSGLDLVDPVKDARDKQVQEIADLLESEPIPPTPEQVQAAVQQQIAQIAQMAELSSILGSQPPGMVAGPDGGIPATGLTPELVQQLMVKLTPQITQQLTRSSVPVDPECDNHVVEGEECLRFINSPAGQKAKRNKNHQPAGGGEEGCDPDCEACADQAGYMNVRLHMMEHAQAAKTAQPLFAPPAPVLPPGKGQAAGHGAGAGAAS